MQYPFVFEWTKCVFMAFQYKNDETFKSVLKSMLIQNYRSIKASLFTSTICRVSSAYYVVDLVLVEL